MMKKLLLLLMISAMLQAAAAPVFLRRISVPGKDENNTCRLTVFVPDPVRGFRLKTPAGEVLPLTLAGRNGGEVSLWFNPRSGIREYVLELDSEPVRNTPAVQRSGVLHRCREYRPRRPVMTPEAFREEWDRAKTPVFSGWMTDGIYTGTNRLVSSRQSLNVYTAFFFLKEAGTWFFYTASTDASFLRIDDQLVAAWPGRHPVWAGLRGEFKGKIFLKSGTHKLEYLHANDQWTYYALAARSKPGDKRLSPLRRWAFLPLGEAQAGPLLTPDGKKAAPDHSWERTGVLDMEGLQLTEYLLDRKTFLYFTDPAASCQEDSFTIRNRYHYHAPMVDNRKAEEMLRRFWKSAEGRTLSESEVRFLALALPMLHISDLGEAFFRKIAAEGDSMPKEAVFRFYRKMILEPRLQKEAYEEILRDLKRMLPKNGPEVRLELARVLLFGTGDFVSAKKYLQEIRNAKLDPPDERMRQILEAECALYLEGYDAALERYGKMESRTKRMTSRELVESEGMLLSLRNALITRRYEDAFSCLEKVETFRPEIRMDPELVWLKSQLLAGMKRFRQAERCAEKVLLLHPAPETASEALFFLGDRALTRGDRKKAETSFRRLQEEYPSSRAAVRMERKWKGTGQK